MISLDLRRRILAACHRGKETYQQVADRFEVSRAMVNKLIGQHRRTGSIEPLYDRVGRKRLITGEVEERLVELVRKQPDATLEELRERLGLACNLTTIHRALERLGRSYKKKRRGGAGAKPRGR